MSIHQIKFNILEIEKISDFIIYFQELIAFSFSFPLISLKTN